jgi:hypothetical protein
MAKKMIKKSSWETFRKAGMLWLVNRILHIFGWVIVTELNKKGKVIKVYPARCKFRGFCRDAEDRGFINVSRFMVKNAKRLLGDCYE